MRKKINVILQQLENGGLEKAVITLANALCEREDYEITLYVFLHSKPIIDIADGIKIVFTSKRQLKKESLPEKYLRKFSELQVVKKIIRGFHNSIVISTRNEYTTIISKYTDNTNYIIGQLHNDYSSKEFKDFCSKYKNINAFVQLNKTFKDEIEPALRKKNKFTKLPVIPNFIERQVYTEETRENFVIAVGRITKVKGYERLIEIWDMVSKKNDKWKLVIIGDGEDFNKLSSLIREKHLEEKIIMPGWLSINDVYNYMRKSKIYALTSFSESFSLVTIEAMQNKLPVIAFDVRTGPRNIINDQETGFLVKEGNLKEYAKRIELLMNDDKLLQKMSLAAYKRSEDFFKENVIKQWYELIDNANIGGKYE